MKKITALLEDVSIEFVHRFLSIILIKKRHNSAALLDVRQGVLTQLSLKFAEKIYVICYWYSFLLSFAMLVSLPACGDKKAESSNTAETTEITTTTPLKDINLDNKHTLNDVIVPFPSDWKLVDSDQTNNITYIHGEGGLVMLAS